MIEKKEIKKENLVVKNNDLIFKIQDLSLQEQRIVLLLISFVDSQEDREFYKYTFSIKEFCELIGIKGKAYSYIEDTTRKLMSKVIEFEDGKNLIQLHWISSCRYNRGEGSIQLELHNDLIPYLLNIKEKFTCYALADILNMKSKFSIRLYEILKSQEYKGTYKTTPDELKQLLNCEKYERFSNFNQKVLKIAIDEIENYTDLTIECIQIKSGKNVVALDFKISSVYDILKAKEKILTREEYNKTLLERLKALNKN